MFQTLQPRCWVSNKLAQRLALLACGRAAKPSDWENARDCRRIPSVGCRRCWARYISRAFAIKDSSFVEKLLIT
jgi:hypothetical protein